MKRIAVGLVLCLAFTSWAQDNPIVITQVGRLIRIEAKDIVGPHDAGTARWVNPLPQFLDVIPVDQNAGCLVLAHKAGDVRLVCYAVKGGQPTPPAWVTLRISEASTPKPPGPVTPTPPGPTPPTPEPPEPDPTPPVGTGRYIAIVEVPAQRTPAQAKVLTDATLWRALEAEGHRYRIFSNKSQAAIDLGYVKLAELVGYPAMIIMDKKGTALNTMKLPETADGVKNAIKETQ